MLTFCLVTKIFWSCYCLRFEFLRLEKNWDRSWRLNVVTVSVFSEKENIINEACTIFEVISKQNKCKFFWLPNKMWAFRGLFITKSNFMIWNWISICKRLFHCFGMGIKICFSFKILGTKWQQLFGGPSLQKPRTKGLFAARGAIL